MHVYEVMQHILRLTILIWREVPFYLNQCNGNIRVLLFPAIRQREDVYRVIKAFAVKGERIGPEATRFLQCLVQNSFATCKIDIMF